MTPAPRERFAEMVFRPEARIDLAEAALLVAAEEYPSLDLTRYLRRLDALANEARGHVRDARSVAERVARLNQQLFVAEGFRGNREHYDDPRNSFLNDVLDRRTGIPITLSLVYMEVARRLKLDVCGVGFPGHFLVKCVEEEEIVIDPFCGCILTQRECQGRLAAAVGAGSLLRPDVHLRAATPRQILVRLLTNLKVLYAQAGDYERTLACCDRILLVAPDAPAELCDRALVYERLEYFAAALADYERFLELAPEGDPAHALRERVEDLRVKVGRLH